jgi:phosphoribosylformimino-5-aminoimidazole carboxamide ribotide isomerase
MPAQRQPPRLIPVLDVMNGRVVRAVGGERAKYRPICCPRTGSHEPVVIAETLLQLADAAELYVADLDAITEQRRTVAPAVCDLLEKCGVPMWLDAGIGRTDVLDFPESANLRPVVGFETCRAPEILLETLIEPLHRPVAFSVDLKHGRLLGNWRAWGLKNDRDLMTLVRRVVKMGIRALIVLDLARVGTGTGAGTDDLLRTIRDEFPEIDLIAGGGVRTWDDVERLGDAGASGVLVASALHDGTITFPKPSSSAPRP